jgi:hypothetical protein
MRRVTGGFVNSSKTIRKATAMNGKLILPLVLLAICSSGCTSLILQHNANKQTTTVSDLLNNEVLYNLALYKDYYDGTRVNGIPSFVQLTTGQSQVQQTVNGQVTPKITTGVSETDLQFMGAHQVQDNWTFNPVVDPNILNRIYLLYRAEFTNVSRADLFKIIPPAPTPLDQQGHPYLQYTPVTNSNGQVLMTNNQPVFTAIPIPIKPPTYAQVPGSIIDANGTRTNGWFSFTPPANNCSSWWPMGHYLHTDIWITNRDNFFQFELLALGGTNSIANPGPTPFTINNGVAVPYLQFR